MSIKYSLLSDIFIESHLFPYGFCNDQKILQLVKSCFFYSIPSDTKSKLRSKVLNFLHRQIFSFLESLPFA